MEPTSIADAEARALADAYMEDARHVGVDRAIYAAYRAIYAAYRAGRDAATTDYEVHRAAFRMAAAWNDAHDTETIAGDWEGMARIALDAARVGHEEPLPPELLEAVFR